MLAGAAEPKQAAPKQKRWGKGRPYFGTIVASQGLCNIASKGDKATIRVEVDLGDSGLSYTPGDALGIIPLNCHEVAFSPLHILFHACSVALDITTCGSHTARGRCACAMDIWGDWHPPPYCVLSTKVIGIC